ncbi:hypothetical protein INP83_11345 [Mucilaginibacter sp. 21P]|uniref:hypothetical protein n=1 Tax=Mucilaginibacter sp. 21P TaxID=2778902 RepID=UPI001C56079D|nr:hypothetical protein [Mucilaginibacter sp. 21P]QXV63705.1 hypothetical protein INP83_11345 [Mucilaginibacter sp. 21P]
MRKLKYYLILLISFCFTQLKAQNDAGYIATMITRTADKDTTRILYCQKRTGERIYVYKIESGMVSSATEFKANPTALGLTLLINPLTSGQLSKDSLLLSFDDKTNSLIVNRSDRYALFPDIYPTVKAQLVQRHQIMRLLQLLSDGIGDYPLGDMIPLLLFAPSNTEHIRSAQIVTRRSQAAVTDHWNVTYSYRNHRLITVRAASEEGIRFTKKTSYNGRRVTVCNYRNIESRQTVNQTVYYIGDRPDRVRLKEDVYETGKDRETRAEITLIRQELGQIAQAKMTPAEVLRLTTLNTKH